MPLSSIDTKSRNSRSVDDSTMSNVVEQPVAGGDDTTNSPFSKAISSRTRVAIAPDMPRSSSFLGAKGGISSVMTTCLAVFVARVESRHGRFLPSTSIVKPESFSPLSLAASAPAMVRNTAKPALPMVASSGGASAQTSACFDFPEPFAGVFTARDGPVIPSTACPTLMPSAAASMISVEARAAAASWSSFLAVSKPGMAAAPSCHFWFSSGVSAAVATSVTHGSPLSTIAGAFTLTPISFNPALKARRRWAIVNMLSAGGALGFRTRL